MANNSIKINFECIIDISPKYEKIYPLPCCQHEQKISKLRLKRTYKALCQICNSVTSTYNKNRIAICPTCERKDVRKNLWAICYNCNQTVNHFKKTNKGFICHFCSDIRETKFCPICEYEVFTLKKGIHICDYCKAGNIRKSRILKENKVLCCNCEQVAIQINPNNQNVYCNECKYELFGCAYNFDRV